MAGNDIDGVITQLHTLNTNLKNLEKSLTRIADRMDSWHVAKEPIAIKREKK